MTEVIFRSEKFRRRMAMLAAIIWLLAVGLAIWNWIRGEHPDLIALGAVTVTVGCCLYINFGNHRRKA